MTAISLSNPPRAFVLSTGSEITQGTRTDTNATHLSRSLTEYGFHVVGHAAVPDSRERIEAALRNTFGVADLVVMTGGIGPTEDDLCREVLADVMEAPLHRVHRAESMMRALFARRSRPMPERNVKQALLPTGALPLLNFWGTAMGVLVPAGADGRPMIVSMPGVPREWKAMWARYAPRMVLPAFPGLRKSAATTLHVAGLAESEVNELLLPLFEEDPRVEVGLLASLGVIRVRLNASGETTGEACELLESFRVRVLELLPTNCIFAEGEDTLTPESVVVERFRAAGKTIALAESCTGGGVAKRLTDVPSSSQVLREGWVTYSNAAKQARLGVSPATLEHHGAVSKECVHEMAAGALRESGANVAVAISGIAGPTGGTEEKPVGLVWFGLAAEEEVGRTFSSIFPGNRETVRVRAENTALDLLRRWVDGLPLEEESEQ
ncbi:MAG: nicotinamide-nucleotide amidase [Candidatus Sumerlaeota bacterium]|nr:nicotinamide-nucleotide amidase [Candidatus Sumerlaeota bacterium]